MAVKVVDASALAALIFAEPDSAGVEARLTGHYLIAPALLPFEMSSVCLKKVRRNPAQRDAILARFAMFVALAIELYPIDPAAVVQVAEVLSLTAYDASYLLLARQMRAELVTLDAQLQNAAAI